MPEYRTPSFLKPRTYEEIPGSIDALFNAYQQSRKQSFGEASQAFGLQSQLARQGIDPTGYDLNNPGAFFEPILQEERAKKLKGQETQEAELAKTRAETQKDLASAKQLEGQAKYYEALGGEFGGKPKMTEYGGVPAIEEMGPKGIKRTFLPGQKGSEESSKNVADAIQSYGKIDEYFNAVESSGGELSKRFATSELPGSQLFNPKVAQSETALLNLFIFANGGKAITDSEQRIIKGIAKSSAFGPEQREQARRDMKALLQRRIRATLESGATGGAKPFLERELGAISGTQTKTKYSNMSDDEIRRQLNAP